MKNKVQLLGYYGGDKRHALSAWQSTSDELNVDLPEDIEERIDFLFHLTEASKKKSADDLLYFLATADPAHTSPFRKSHIDFQITGDIASHIHSIKHTLSQVNSESARYKELKDKWYIPEDWDIDVELTLDDFSKYENAYSIIKNLLIQKYENEQPNFNLTDTIKWSEVLNSVSKINHEFYHLALDKLTAKLGRKRAKESSRYFLNYNKQLNYDWQMNFLCFVNVCRLRAHPDAQLEIRQITNTMLHLVETIPGQPFKTSLEVFNLKSDPNYIL